MKKIIGLTALTCLSLPAFAELKDDKSLYDLAPEDAAFVRVINTTSNSSTTIIGRTVIETPGGCAVSKVDWVKPGVQLSDAEESQTGMLHTYVISDDGGYWQTNTSTVDPLRAHLAILNLSKSDQVSLLTTKGERPVFKQVVPGERKVRAVNPISISLTATDQQTSVELDPVNLKRGQISETVICSTDGVLQVANSTY